MNPTTSAEWHEYAAGLALQTRLLIDGRWIPASDGGSLATINPATGEEVAAIASGTQSDVEQAAMVGRKRFEQGAWSGMAQRRRVEVLMRFADLVEEYKFELAALDTLEMGKPISEMLSIDVPGSVLTLRYMAESLDKTGGACPTTDQGALHYILRQPLGVVGCITPWNYPLMMAVWKVAPALAAGNSVVLKPAEDTSLSALVLGRLFLEAGGPDGVFNVVPGRGTIAGKALALSHFVDKIAFTGSTAVGRLMYEYSAKSNLKKVSAELGGKSPQIILEDAGDLPHVASVVASGLFGNQGEVCSAGSRILVARRIHDEFCTLLKEAAKNRYLPGDPFDPSTTMGPLVNRTHQDRVLGYATKAAQEGATPLLSGNAHEDMPSGCYVSPTLFSGVTNAMTLAREEVFGPVGAVIAHDGPEEAITIANDSSYGLAAGIWTQNLNHAHRIARNLTCGMVWVNGYMNGDMSQPWGGWKQSGQGRDKCMDALLENTQTKSVWVTLDQ